MKTDRNFICTNCLRMNFKNFSLLGIIFISFQSTEVPFFPFFRFLNILNIEYFSNIWVIFRVSLFIFIIDARKNWSVMFCMLLYVCWTIELTLLFIYILKSNVRKYGFLFSYTFQKKGIIRIENIRLYECRIALDQSEDYSLWIWKVSPR